MTIPVQLQAPLLDEKAIQKDVEKGVLKNGEHYTGATAIAQRQLKGCAPLLPQLPTDTLGPANQHKAAALKVTRGVIVPAAVADKLSALPGGLEAITVAAFAALLGRYARANEVALCLWRASSKDWAPLRISLLRPENERGAADEDSSITPAGAFTCARDIATRVAMDVAAVDVSGTALDDNALAALDVALAADSESASETRSGPQQTFSWLEAAVALGGAPAARPWKPHHHVTLVIPSWPPLDGRDLKLELHHTQGCFQVNTARRILRHYAALLKDLQRVWSEPICNLRLHNETTLNPEEASDVVEWSDAFSNSCYCPAIPGHWSANRPIHSLFDECVARTPDATAIIDDGTGQVTSYRGLSAAADAVASVLQAHGVGPDVLVPLMAPRGTPMIYGMFGILRSGGAYVPMDLHWPDERLKDVLEQCGAKVLLGSRCVQDRLAGLGATAKVLCIEDLVAAGGKLVPNGHRPPQGEDMVYVFFTSGTTGKPKGVMVEHRGLTHRIHWFQQRWPLFHGEAVMQKVAYTFGLSEWEIFWPLSYGAALVLAPPGGEKDADYLLRRACGVFQPPAVDGKRAPEVKLAAHIFVPSALQMVLEQFDELEEAEVSRKGGIEPAEGTWWRNAPVRQVITCGEPLTAPLCQKMFSRLSSTELINLYGPTEGEVTYWDATRGVTLSRVPAGAAMAGSKVVLADLRERRVASSLEPAEIAFGGPFIARGYLGRPDLDAKAFVPDFSGDCVGYTGESRLYLTGDLGRWREGDIELLGRRDFQVKLRGFRIELGEIESAIRAAGARAAVCVVRAGVGGAAALVAYYEPGAEGKVSETAVRASCKKLLPPYMQPQVVMQLDKLPRNANGKVDRPKLPAPPESAAPAADAAANFSAPETATEIAIAAVWAEVLKMDEAKVPADTDFQELGGSSLLAGRATALIRKRLAVTGLPGTSMYKHPTVRRLGVFVDGLLATQKAEVAAECTGASCETLTAAETPQPPMLSNTRPLALLLQLIGVVGLNFVFESGAWSPFWWHAWFLYAYTSRTACILFLPVAVVGDFVLQVLIAAAFKWIFVGQQKPGAIPLWSVAYFRWWVANSLFNRISSHVFPLIAETPLAVWLLRLFGAKIGKNVRISVTAITEPDLLVCGDNVTIGKKTRLTSSAVLRGQVHLDRIVLEDNSAVGHCSVLSQGTVVPQGTAVMPLSSGVGWHGAVGAMSFQKAEPTSTAEFNHRQDVLRMVFGFPIVILTLCIPYVSAMFALEALWTVLKANFGKDAFFYFSISLSWLYVHPIWITYTILVVLQKRLLIGRFTPGHTEWSQWAEFKHWLHARAMESHEFTNVCEMWVNTDVLSWIYRLMGAKVGRRVQIDHFHAVEHDCIEIDDYTVFGSEVTFSCDSRMPWTPNDSRPKGYEVTHLRRASNVLDHCVLLPGTEVAERAVLGTCTLAHRGSYITPMAIHTGSNRGRSLHLRDHSATPATRVLEDNAMRSLDDPKVWYGFNAFVVFLTFLVKPMPEALWVLTYFGVTSCWDPETGTLLELLLITPWVYFIVCLCECAVVISAKWLIMGRYKVGDFPFFGAYHLRWLATMVFTSGMSDFAEAIIGTVFRAWFFRANGARVGKNCYLAGLAVEYDLLSVGDNVCIGSGCDTTAHTVENMVIKLARTRIGDGATLCPASFASPGSVVETDSVILENSQVLKGETVPAGEIWSGMPAAQCRPRKPASSASKL